MPEYVGVLLIAVAKSLLWSLKPFKEPKRHNPEINGSHERPAVSSEGSVLGEKLGSQRIFTLLTGGCWEHGNFIPIQSTLNPKP